MQAGTFSLKEKLLTQQRELQGTGCRRQCPFNKCSSKHVLQRLLPNEHCLVEQFQSPAFCGLFSGDGEMYLSACKGMPPYRIPAYVVDATITLYDTNTWKKSKTIKGNDVGWSIVSCDFSRDKQWLIYSSWSDRSRFLNHFNS